MAALVQTIPQQSGTVSVLQTRPSSSSGTFTPSQSSQQQNSRNPAMSWNTYNTTGSHRGSHPVVAPYAFTSTPSLPTSPNTQSRQSWAPHLRPESRTSSAPSAPQVSHGSSYAGANPRFVHHPAAGSVSTLNPSLQLPMSKDDTAIPSRQPRGDPAIRPLSTANLPSPSPFMNISSPTVARPSPERYRRGNRRPDSVAAPLAAHTTTRGPPPPADDQSVHSNVTSPSGSNKSLGHNRVSSADDTALVEKTQPELAKRYRRRSWGNMEAPGQQLHLPKSSPVPTTGAQDYFDPNHRPQSSHSHRDVPGSVHSAHSSTSSVREPGHTEAGASSTPKMDENKRTPKPSPLSQPMSSDPAPSTPAPSTTKPAQPDPKPSESPASQRLANIAGSDLNRPGKSRLRRAFSFGSASELLKASQQSSVNKKEAIAAEKARRDLLQEELGPEQAAIAEQQEASGLGESIYSHHQARFFNSSTDNISVSSTASSASVMLRKMGKGMKRSTRSLVGLFRPKSVVETTSNDGKGAEATAPQLSMVNIEADRTSVTVNPDPQDLPRGGTVFPKVEPDSADAVAHDKMAMEKSQSRKSIVGGDRERAEVLAAVRKGILKKTYSSPVVPTLKQTSEASQANGTDSPHSSAPSTPEDQARGGNKRLDAVKIAGDEDVLTDSKSAPATPQEALPKSLVFSPRIQFHETWPSGEYDRRGDIATCNRLTPLLAQQIKEELNNFKMEMEVHETSKVYTHFL